MVTVLVCKYGKLKLTKTTYLHKKAGNNLK